MYQYVTVDGGWILRMFRTSLVDRYEVQNELYQCCVLDWLIDMSVVFYCLGISYLK